MSVRKRFARQVWLGDSHLMAHHGTPDHFYDLMKKRGVESTRWRHRIDLSGLKSGLKMTQEWTEDVIKKIKDKNDRPSIYVLCVGTNNVRQQANMDEVEKIVEWHEAIAKAVRETECSVLLVVSPISDSKKYTQDFMEMLHCRLEIAMADADYIDGKFYDCIRYVNFVDKYLPYRPQAGRRYRKDLYKDPVHLNKAGTKLLAKEIFNQLTQISNHAFGFAEVFPTHKEKKEFWSRLQMTRAEFRDEVDIFLRTIREAAPGSTPYLQPLPFGPRTVIEEIEEVQEEQVDLRQVLEDRKATKDSSTTFHAIDWEMEDLTAVDANGNPI